MHTHWQLTTWDRLALAMPLDVDLTKVAVPPQPRRDAPALPWRTP